jgi:hypothetical protein
MIGDRNIVLPDGTLVSVEERIGDFLAPGSEAELIWEEPINYHDEQDDWSEEEEGQNDIPYICVAYWKGVLREWSEKDCPDKEDAKDWVVFKGESGTFCDLEAMVGDLCEEEGTLCPDITPLTEEEYLKETQNDATDQVPLEDSLAHSTDDGSDKTTEVIPEDVGRLGDVLESNRERHPESERTTEESREGAIAHADEEELGQSSRESKCSDGGFIVEPEPESVSERTEVDRDYPENVVGNQSTTAGADSDRT